MRADRSRLPDVGPDPAFSFPSIVRHELPNGLRIRTVEHRSVPVVTCALQIEGGAGADPADREGLVAVVADMVDEGTGSLSAIDVSDAIGRIGAEYSVDVAPDVTTLSLTTLTRFASRGAALLSSIATEPSLREEDFARVRQLRLDRLRQLKDLPPAVAERAFLRLLYGEHPYGHASIGSDAALRALTLDEVAACHATLFRPDRATLVVVGSLGHDQLLELAREAFGGWVKKSGGARSGAPASEIPPSRRSQVSLAMVPRDGAAQSELRIGHLAARRDNPDYSALLVMNAVLGGQFVSRVNLKLREEKGYTYGARTGFDWRRGVAPFQLQASVHTAATADAIRDSLAELDAIRGSRPATEAELFLAKASLTRGYPRGFETVQQVAYSVAQLALYGFGDTYFEEFVPRVNAVTAADVTRVAERYLAPDQLITLVVGDHRAVEASLGALGLGAPTLLSADA